MFCLLRGGVGVLLFNRFLLEQRVAYRSLLVLHIGQPLNLQQDPELLFHLLPELVLHRLHGLLSATGSDIIVIFGLYGLRFGCQEGALVLVGLDGFDPSLILFCLLLAHVMQHVVEGFLAAVEPLNAHLELLDLQGLSKLLRRPHGLNVALPTVIVPDC